MEIKRIAFGEVILMLFTIFSFAYLMGQTLPTVEANPFLPTSCCPETVGGSVCLDVLQSDSGLCATDLIPSSCETVESCQSGCCYDSSGGSCTLSSPKSPCENNGGEWFEGDMCAIPQCDIGCCVLGSQAVPSTTRECTRLSAEYGFDKSFQAMDSSGFCEAYVNPAAKGACVMDSGDFSGENNCLFTEKSNCNSEFHEGKLCTSLDLDTVCVPSMETTCLEGRDQVYFLDSCDNIANIYDSSKVDDQEYWEEVITPINSCSGDAEDCGNCDYTQGNYCTESKVTGVQPTYGDNACLDLNCDNGVKHGESWCVYDYDLDSIAPVGTRHFVATCLEGEVFLEGCADFNQEICIQGSSGDVSVSKCYPNDWRSCVNANGRGDYAQVKTGCDQLPQCQMFNEYYGVENVKESLGGFFAGFDPALLNTQQGAAGGIGSGSNDNIPYCIPKYTPGFQFWNSQTSTSTIGNGGSAGETSAICSLSSFTCISRMMRECTLTSCDGWEDIENWECNVNGDHSTIRTVDLPNLMAAMNERCRALGTCGTNIGVDGNFGFDDGFSLTRVKIDENGDQIDNITLAGYNLTNNYLSSIISSSGLVKAGDMDVIPYGIGLIGEDSGAISEQVTGSAINAATIIAAAIATFTNYESSSEQTINLVGGLATTAISLAATGSGGLAGAIGSGAGLAGGGYAVAIVAVGALIGYQIGSLISDNQDWSPQKANQFNLAMAGVGGAVAGTLVTYAAATSTTIGAGAVGSATVVGGSAAVAAGAGAAAPAATGFFASLGAFGTLGLIGAVAALIYAIYMSFFDTFDETKYYILQFTCEGWEPARGGDCNACNEDVRPCSENRCRSIGANCRYYNDLGEPGTCASISDTWQAIIEPWQEVLTEDNVYTNVGQGGFSIEGPSSGNTVKSWEPLVFGIETDKDAECKIDITHTDDYTSMLYDMQSFEYRQHFVIVSQFGEEGTLPMQTGENNYYIRCMNFAGEINEAEFAVQFDLSDEPDVTPPIIISANPANNGYLKYGENSTDLYLSLSEPSECKINNGFDSSYEAMEVNMSCVTNPSLGLMGEWPCYAPLDNLINNQNTFYIKCLDKPGTNGEDGQRMLSPTYIYKIDKCSEGLNIDSISPLNGEIRSDTAGSVELSVQTSGCVNNGESTCYYNFGAGPVQFFTTNSSIHRQTFDTLGDGDYSIDISCIDTAGNEVNGTTNISVEIDNSAPQIVRLYNDHNTLSVRTDEKAACSISNNASLGCNFEILDNELKTLTTFPVVANNNYFVSCKDEFGNRDPSCSEVYIVE